MEFSISSNSFQHLSYNPGIATGVAWDEVMSDLTQYVPSVKHLVRKHDSFGIGLQLSAQTISELSEPWALSELRQFLSQNQCYLFTLDGFNKDLFDWKDVNLLTYHNSLAYLLSKLLPPQITGSISTVPGTPKQFVNTEADFQQITQQWVSHAEHLIRLERATGKQIVLAIKPDAMSFLQTAQQSVDFLNQYVFSTASCTSLSQKLDVSVHDAEDLLRTHITLCLDATETPEEFSSFQSFIKTIESQGLSIGKKQLSVTELDATSLDNQIVTEINDVMKTLTEQAPQLNAIRAA